MPSIPSIQTLTNQNVRAEYEGGFARQNQFQVFITNGWGTQGSSTPFIQHLQNTTNNAVYGFSWNTTFQKKLSFSCSDATLPTSTYATGEVKDNFQGGPQEFAHTRINTDIDFSFYVDRDYTVLTFFEAWMDYVSGGNSNQLGEPSIYSNNNVSGYYRRFNYPKNYKNQNGFHIKKFEKNYAVAGATSVNYKLINAFPKSMTSIPLAYGEAEVMKVTVTMNYDRYRVYRETVGQVTIQPVTTP